jgi:hypothetical protein
MAETLLTVLLWTLALLGAWNTTGMALRIYYGETWWPYVNSVFYGVWASLVLWLR